MFIATIDGGTSNTRSYIWKDGQIAGEARAAVGVRNTAIDGNKTRLLGAVRQTLNEAAQQAGISLADVSLVLAAGMLTSNVGLCEIEHVTAPVTLDELAQAMVCQTIADVCPQAIWFVPGLRNLDPDACTAATIAHMDIMRGEETEAAGLLAYAAPQGPAVLVLPGSHNKYIMLDGQERLLGCLTTLGGEVLHSLTYDTILADTLQRSYAASFDEAAFLRGLADHEQLGLLHGAFMTRILGMFDQGTTLELQNYLQGLLLADDLYSLKRSSLFAGLDDAVFVVAGRPVLQAAYACMFAKQGWRTVLVTAEQQRGLSGYGAIMLAKRRGLIQ